MDEGRRRTEGKESREEGEGEYREKGRKRIRQKETSEGRNMKRNEE